MPASVTIIKIDDDSNQDLRQQYAVTQQTTIVEVDTAGNGLQNYVAFNDPTLQTVIDPGWYDPIKNFEEGRTD